MSAFAPRSLAVRLVALASLLGLPHAARSQRLEPITYRVSIPAPENHLATVEARIPAAGKDPVDLMMAVWSLGFYVQQNYVVRVKDLVARTPEGRELAVEQRPPNRWRVQTGGARTIVLQDVEKVFMDGKAVDTSFHPDYRNPVPRPIADRP